MKIKNNVFLILLLAITLNTAIAQEQKNATDSIKIVDKVSTVEVVPQKKWYDQLTFRGYLQVRYNRLLETNDSLKCEQCDKSWGSGGLFIRRARIVLSGNVHERVFIYIQPDFASSPGTGLNNYGQLRDAYADISLDSKKEFRFRLGQSKIPFGFENMQSSQNRLPLDRDDALNSAFANERDLGVFFYWAPEKTRKLFASLVHDGLKGSGDYGVFGGGIFNGQTANKNDLNKDPYVVARLSYPIEFKTQIVEAGIQAYKGSYVLENYKTSKHKKNLTYNDQRFAASFILYPKPFGLQAEYNFGEGPEFNKVTDSIEVKALKGGYVIASYMLKVKKQILIPFVRIQYYDGGKKHEQDARSYTVHENEIGIEWQPIKNFEFVAMYTISERRFEDFSLQTNHQKGNLLRLQAQVNF